MQLVAIVTGLALLQVFIFAFQVGAARGKYKVNAPAITGAAEFERNFRAHQNTVEQLIIFVPALWMFAYYVNPAIAAGLGLVFIIARQLYRAAYLANPDNRGIGFLAGALAMMTLLIGGMIGAGMSFV